VKIAVTGRPGIGKTTLCMKVYESLKEKMKISGFITKEVRQYGKRVGFRILNLSDGSEEWLERAGVDGDARVGKYAVFVRSLENFLNRVDLDCDLLIVDEVGPMELKSRRFVDFMKSAIESDRILVTVHFRSKHWLVEEIKRKFRVFILEERNRNSIAAEIVGELWGSLNGGND